MLNDASGFKRIYICTGYTDLRKGIDSLAAMVNTSFGLNPAELGSIFLFCGCRNDRMKALLLGRGWLGPVLQAFCGRALTVTPQ